MYENQFTIECHDGRVLKARMILPEKIDNLLRGRIFPRARNRTPEDLYQELAREFEHTVLFEGRSEWLDKINSQPVHKASFLAFRLGCHYEEDEKEDFALLDGLPQGFCPLANFENYMDVSLNLRGTRSEGSLRFVTNIIFKNLVK